MEKTSAAMVNRERAAVMKVLQELGYGVNAKTLTAQVLTKFGERNVPQLFPGSYTLGHKKHEEIYATFKGLYSQKSEINWNMATNRLGSKAPLTKTVASYTRYLTAEDTQNDGTDDEPNATSQQTNNKASTPMSRWGQHYISRPPTDDEDEGGDTEGDEE